MKYVHLFIFLVQPRLFEPSIFRHSRFFEPVVVNSLGFVSVRFYFLYFWTKFSFPNNHNWRQRVFSLKPIFRLHWTAFIRAETTVTNPRHTILKITVYKSNTCKCARAITCTTINWSVLASCAPILDPEKIIRILTIRAQSIEPVCPLSLLVSQIFYLVDSVN